MAAVNLNLVEAREGHLPPVCLCCGEHADHYISKNFSWHPSWVYALIFVGLLPFVIVAMAMTWRARVSAPFCEQHRKHWFNRALIIWLSFGALALVGVAVLVASINRARPGPNDSAYGLACIGLAVGFLVWLVIVAVAQTSTIRATEITDRFIRLTNVSPRFVDSLDSGAQRRFGDDVGQRRGSRELTADDDEFWEERPRREPPSEGFRAD